MKPSRVHDAFSTHSSLVNSGRKLTKFLPAVEGSSPLIFYIDDVIHAPVRSGMPVYDE